MKVIKLIEELQKMPKYADVFVLDRQYSYDSGGHGWGSAEGRYLSGINQSRITKVKKEKNTNNRSIVILD